MTSRTVPDGEHQELLLESERYYARREVIWLTVIGFVLIVVAGTGTWLSRWQTVEFQSVGLVDGRLVSVEYECAAESRLDVDEFDDRVEILLTERPPSDDCDAIYERCIELAEPLADRRVINAGTGDEVVVVLNEMRGRCVDPGDGPFDR